MIRAAQRSAQDEAESGKRFNLGAAHYAEEEFDEGRYDGPDAVVDEDEPL